ncbi:D-2-hydroxyacid dehydrogenase [Maridesulfovibrio hydrothermalis]|uniref:Putative 2-hydroxyacid dehydrogenase HI_1556 n=1 Tax=Maridesulfovibrio hydrothermalis AM13 = DSM 14728 TaxID=1121451 RepID=L0RFJ9_9BACT|nr:D-2-hydroxyacid dehydrogenase [Maridesulfovibrio hydrothermalis]CCO24992.1 putative 2-hydroxyacid dehydrogenase HI_1556 [Maridesulfovibrio hydrothermalis AM13 = DSM 14728]
MQIVILDGYTVNPGDNPWSELEKLGELTVYDRTPQDQIITRACDADIVLTNKTLLTAETINKLPRLKFISVLATGYNVVDLDAASKRGIPVSNVPGYSPPSVAQHVFAMLLNFANRVSLHDQAVKNGEWAMQQDFCFWKEPLFELKDKKIGIVGFGDIGKKVGTIANAFGMEVMAYAPRPKPEPDYSPFSFATLEEIFCECDVVTLHCPLTDENERFINKALLSRMKKNAYIINTARGQLIDENDLAEALKNKIIAGAALDVVDKEPMMQSCALCEAPNLTITPHIAWATLEARSRLTEGTVLNVDSFLKGSPANVVNLI